MDGKSALAHRFMIFMLAILLALTPTTAAFGFDGLPKDLEQLLDQGVRYFNPEVACEGSVDIGKGELVTIIGDSITVGSEAAIKSQLPEAKIYAKTSKQLGGTSTDNPTGLDIVKDSATDLRDYVVIALGSNDTNSATYLNDLNFALKDKNVLYLNNYYYNDLEYFKANNTGFAQAAASKTTISLADWATAAHADYAKYIDNSDGLGVHPTDEGKTLFAGVIVDGLNSMLTTITSDAGVPTQTNGGASVVVNESGQFYQEAYNALKDNDLAKNIYMKFKSLGLDDLHTAAVVGNFYVEGMNLKYTPVHSSSAGLVGGYGLAQWGGGRTSGSPADGTGRDGGLYRYAISKGEPGLEASWETQVEYAWAEMTGKGPAASYATSQYNHDTFMSKTTLDDAAKYFQTDYERGGGTEERQDAANAAYKLFYGLGGSLCGSTSGNGDIAEAAIKLSSGEWEGGCYQWGGGHGSYEDQQHRIDIKWRPRAEGGVDCSGFAMSVVGYAVGKYVSIVTSTTNPGKDWQKSDSPEPGMISTSSGHVEIITKVENGQITETVGSHSSRGGTCGRGPSPSLFDEGNYFRYTGTIGSGSEGS
jgi:lysophospholipase L1-like esterase